MSLLIQPVETTTILIRFHLAWQHLATVAVRVIVYLECDMRTQLLDLQGHILSHFCSTHFLCPQKHDTTISISVNTPKKR